MGRNSKVSDSETTSGMIHITRKALETPESKIDSCDQVVSARNKRSPDFSDINSKSNVYLKHVKKEKSRKLLRSAKTTKIHKMKFESNEKKQTKDNKRKNIEQNKPNKKGKTTEINEKEEEPGSNDVEGNKLENRVGVSDLSVEDVENSSKFFPVVHLSDAAKTSDFTHNHENADTTDKCDPPVLDIEETMAQKVKDVGENNSEIGEKLCLIITEVELAKPDLKQATESTCETNTLDESHKEMAEPHENTCETNTLECLKEAEEFPQNICESNTFDESLKETAEPHENTCEINTLDESLKQAEETPQNTCEKINTHDEIPEPTASINVPEFDELLETSQLDDVRNKETTEVPCINSDKDVDDDESEILTSLKVDMASNKEEIRNVTPLADEVPNIGPMSVVLGSEVEHKAEASNLDSVCENKEIENDAAKLCLDSGSYQDNMTSHHLDATLNEEVIPESISSTHNQQSLEGETECSDAVSQSESSELKKTSENIDSIEEIDTSKEGSISEALQLARFSVLFCHFG